VEDDAEPLDGHGVSITKGLLDGVSVAVGVEEGYGTQ